MQAQDFIHHENLALFRSKLADPKLTDERRKKIEQLLAEEEAKDRQVPN